MTNISITENNTKVRFHKQMWHESEIILAKCFNFNVDIDSGVIVCELAITSKKALYDFIRISFKNFSESVAEDQHRNNFFTQIESIYNSVSEYTNNVMKVNLPYYDKLYAHQKDVLNESFFKQFNFLALSMGLGKSLTSASISRMHGIPRTVIFCPAAVKYNWFRDLVKFGYNEMFFSVLDSSKRRTIIALSERFVIINYDIITKFEPHLISSDVGHFILDECFVYDTIVETNIGRLKIGDIVENKINCYALSYDSLNNAYIYKPVSNWIKKQNKERLVKIKANGNEIVCTENHKIHTSKGWKKAICLSNSDELLVLSERVFIKKEREINGKILLSKMLFFLERSKYRLFGKIKGSFKKKTSNFENKLSCLREGEDSETFSNIKENREKKHEILWNKMFCNMENEQFGTEIKEEKNRFGKGIRKDESGSLEEPKHSQDVIFENEAKQSNEEPRSISENEKKPFWKNVFIKRWERSNNKTTRAVTQNNWLANGIRNCNVKCKTLISICAKPLQGRLGDTRKEDSCGSRWKFSQTKEMEVPRQKKDRNFKYVRVESCEILERRSDGESKCLHRESYVYDLTVEDNHNYFANNILVSNCHGLKNHNSQRTKNVKSIIDHFPNARISFLSGTPIKNRVNDVFSYLKIINHELGKNHKKFLDEFTIRSNNRGGEKVTGGKNLQDLHLKLSNFMIRKTKEECLDLPEKVFLSYRFEMDDWRDEYNKIIEELSQLKEVSRLTGNLHSLNIITSKAKVKGIIEIAENILSEGRKVVIFGSYKEPLKELESYFGNRCVKIDGSVQSFERDRLVQKFINEDSCTVFLGNMIAAGVGINLVNASDVVFMNFPFTPSELYQSVDRCHRIGQSKSVNVHFTFCDDSIDEYIHEIIIDKEKDINSVIDLGKEAMVREDMMEVLMKKLLKKDVIELVDDTVHKVDGVPVLFNGHPIPKNPLFHDNEMFNNSSSEMIIVDQKSLNLNGLSDKIDKVKSYKDPVLNILTPPPGF